MPVISSDHPFLNFEDDFEKIPLCNIQDKRLKNGLKAFLTDMNAELNADFRSPIYGTSHCDWMVGHGLQHSRDVWVIANRFFDTYKNFPGLPPLNDKEKYCLSCAIWLHDIGMSTMMAPIGEQINNLNEFWKNKNLNGEFPQNLPQNLIRKYHSFLSRFFIINPTRIIRNGNPIHTINNDELKECIALICCYHQSKWKFHNEPGNSFFGTLTEESIYETDLESGIYRTTDNVDINILYLSALLRFFDECDQIISRVGDGDVIERDTEEGLNDEYNRILNCTRENTELHTAWEVCHPPDIYRMSIDQSKQKFDNFETLLKRPDYENIRKHIFGESYEEYKSICIETHSHFIAKVILDIGFGIENDNTIIKIQCDPKDQYVNDFKTGVIENLEICQRFFSSNPTTMNANNLFDMNTCFDVLWRIIPCGCVIPPQKENSENPKRRKMKPIQTIPITHPYRSLISPIFVKIMRNSLQGENGST